MALRFVQPAIVLDGHHVGGGVAPARAQISDYNHLYPHRQTTARKNEWPLDKMTLTVDVLKKSREEIAAAPREGAYLHGLFLEGSRWDTNTGKVTYGSL